MRALVLSLTFALAASISMAQPWEIGVAGGYGFYRDASITSSGGQAQAGFGSNFAVGAVFSEDLYKYLSGEIRYMYRGGGLELKSAGREADMDGESHAIHYDILLHATPKESKIRPFAAGGGGVKVYRGTGRETASQPLSGFALLTKTRQWEPMISFGGGVKYSMSKHTLLRLEFRDYVTPFPEKLFVTMGSAKIHGWLHDFVPMAGISFVF